MANRYEKVPGGDLPGDLGAEPGRLAIRNNLLEEALLRLRQHQLLEHPRALPGQIQRSRPGHRHLPRLIIPQKGVRACRRLERIASLLEPVGDGPIGGERDLAVDGAEVEEHGGLLKVDVLQRGLLVGLEGVVPREGDGAHLIAVGGEGEAGFHGAEGPEVGLEEIASGLRRVGRTLEIGSHLADGLKVVFEVLRLPLRVVDGDVLAEGPVEIDGGGLLLVDRKHHVVRRHRVESIWFGGFREEGVFIGLGNWGKGIEGLGVWRGEGFGKL